MSAPKFMLLITPDILVQMLCPGEYKSFLGDMLPSVPDRTRRNLKKGSKPSKKAMDTIVSDICSMSSLGEAEVRAFMKAQTPQPWLNAVMGLKKAPHTIYRSSFDYATDLIIQIESTPFIAAAEKQRGNPRWADQFKLTGLPSAVMPESFLATCFQIGKSKKQKEKGRVVPIDSGRVLLRTTLFLLAALEASLMNSDLIRPGTEAWVHKMMPYYREGKLVEPIREFFEVVMEKLEIQSVAKFAELLPPLTLPSKDKNIDSQKRQVRRWMSGEIPPSWENMRSISDSFFWGDDGPMVSYGVARFLQSLLRELRSNYIPIFFKDEEELVSIFQEYSGWQEYHQEGFAKWNKARN